MNSRLSLFTQQPVGSSQSPCRGFLCARFSAVQTRNLQNPRTSVIIGSGSFSGNQVRCSAEVRPGGALFIHFRTYQNARPKRQPVGQADGNNLPVSRGPVSPRPGFASRRDAITWTRRRPAMGSLFPSACLAGCSGRLAAEPERRPSHPSASSWQPYDQGWRANTPGCQVLQYVRAFWGGGPLIGGQP
jgi:hypothetical protein